jgi:hypothetical protein
LERLCQYYTPTSFYFTWCGCWKVYHCMRGLHDVSSKLCCYVAFPHLSIHLYLLLSFR